LSLSPLPTQALPVRDADTFTQLRGSRIGTGRSISVGIVGLNMTLI